MELYPLSLLIIKEFYKGFQMRYHLILNSVWKVVKLLKMISPKSAVRRYMSTSVLVCPLPCVCDPLGWTGSCPDYASGVTPVRPSGPLRLVLVLDPLGTLLRFLSLMFFSKVISDCQMYAKNSQKSFSICAITDWYSGHSSRELTIQNRFFQTPDFLATIQERLLFKSDLHLQG